MSRITPVTLAAMMLLSVAASASAQPVEGSASALGESGRPIVVIDPGHGGKDEGTMNRAMGIEEKGLVLEISHKLKLRLEADARARVLMTRDGDYFIPLEDRTAFANRNKAVLFLSIHANSARSTKVKGFETYFLSQKASDNKAFELAAAENESAKESEADSEVDPLQFLLFDMAQNEHQKQSFELADRIQTEVLESLGVPNRGVRQAPFNVLRGAQMPAVLVEVGFLSNAAEARKLIQSDYQDKIVEGLVRAISQFLDTLTAMAPPQPEAR